MGKGRKLIVLLATLAAFLCLTAGCGIPTYFYTDNNYEVHLGKKGDVSYIGFTSRAGSDGDLARLDPGGGPGLLLFYYISDSSIETDKSKLNSAFKEKFQGPSKIGISSGDLRDDELFLRIEDKDGKVVRDYGAFCLESGMQQSPSYALRLDQRTPEGNIKLYYELSPNPDGTVAFRCGSSDDLDGPGARTLVLSRYNGEPFGSGEDLDSAGLYVYIYATLVFRGEKFSNVFWTDPRYCGQVGFGPAR